MFSFLYVDCFMGLKFQINEFTKQIWVEIDLIRRNREINQYCVLHFGLKMRKILEQNLSLNSDMLNKTLKNACYRIWIWKHSAGWHVLWMKSWDQSTASGIGDLWTKGWSYILQENCVIHVNIKWRSEILNGGYNSTTYVAFLWTSL